jgi:hypothetical protein
MVANPQVRIEIEAAKALAQWKRQFAEEVARQAKRLAMESGPPNLVTLANYRQAAGLAVQSLARAIQSEINANGKSEAA